ncbi:MAG: hypothetical protein EOO06_20820 [Chitinophagaceae bacterium]|nr:MAG: hypothetical protein EOO06_20820 [Chitinophagaceae bacterium]
MQEQSFLSLEVIWKDDHMLELEVVASNKFFKGVTQVYDQADCLYQLSERLLSFSNNSQPVFYEAGEKDSYSYISLKFYPVNSTGIIGVQIHLEENVPTEYRPEEKSKLALEILTELSAIDDFQRFLKTMAEKHNGKAQLNGR